MLSRNPVPVTARESQLLQILCMNKGEIVKRNSIIENLWEKEGNDFFASRSLDVFINKLRKKFVKDPTVEIRVVKGIGIILQD